MQVSLARLENELTKIDASSTRPLYAKVLEISSQLKATGIIQGSPKVNKIFEILPGKATDVNYLRGKLQELKLLTNLSKEIVAENQGDKDGGEGQSKQNVPQNIIIKESW